MIAATFTPEEKTALFSALAAITQRLNEAFAPRTESSPALPAEAQRAFEARAAARARGFHTVKSFAAAIGRHPHTVSDDCRARVVKTLKGGKPYRIPLTEEDRWNRLQE